jgi:hypothetical protein
MSRPQASDAKRMVRSPSRGNGDRMVAISDVSGLLSSPWALARAAEMAPIEGLGRCMDGPIHEVKADGPGFNKIDRRIASYEQRATRYGGRMINITKNRRAGSKQLPWILRGRSLRPRNEAWSVGSEDRVQKDECAKEPRSESGRRGCRRRLEPPAGVAVASNPAFSKRSICAMLLSGEHRPPIRRRFCAPAEAQIDLLQIRKIRASQFRLWAIRTEPEIFPNLVMAWRS